MLISTALESSAAGYLREKLVFLNQQSAYTLSFKSLNLDLLGEKLKLEGIKLTSSAKSVTKNEVSGLEIGSITLHGISASHFLFNKDLDISYLALDTVTLVVQKPKSQNKKVLESQKGSFDSISLPGIKKLSLGLFEVEHFKLLFKDPEGDTLGVFAGDELVIKGIQMSEANTSHTFRPILDSLSLELNNQNWKINNGTYSVSYDHLKFLNREKQLSLSNFSITPLLSQSEFNALNNYSFETYKIEIPNLKAEGIDLLNLIKGEGLYVRSVHLDGIKTDIFRNKSLPFNTKKNVKLPVAALREIKFPFRIDTVKIREGYLHYGENLEHSKQSVGVDLKDLNVLAFPIVSGGFTNDKKSLLNICLSSNLLGVLPVNLDLQLPYSSDALAVQGSSSGSSALHTLNPTVYPAINMRFTGGDLTGISFSAHGNSKKLTGQLTMLYKDLEVEFLSNQAQRQRAKSFVVNALVRNSNPNKRGKTIVGVIDYERLQHKGLGNFIWKAVQSGVVNSLNPIGKHHKQ